MKRKETKNKRGSALLLTLGTLCLALVMAMSFAFSARTSLQVAEVNADQTKARLIAESGLSRVMAILQKNAAGKAYYAGDTTSSGNYHFRNTSTGSYTLRHLMSVYPTGGDNEAILKTELAKAKTSLPWLSNLGGSTIPPEGASGRKFGFQPVYDANDRIIGRIGYIVIDETDKLDVNQLFPLHHNDSSTNSPYIKYDSASSGYSNELAPYCSPSSTDYISKRYVATTDYLLNLTRTSDGFIPATTGSGGSSTPINDDSPQTIRLGLSLKEVWFDGRKGYYTKRIFPENSLHRFLPYSSYRQLALNTSHAPLKHTFFSGKDIEAYWNGSDECQRFDLTGNEWKSSTTKNGWDEPADLAAKQNLVEALYSDPGSSESRAPLLTRASFYSDATRTTIAAPPKPSTAGFGIPCLYNSEDLPRRRQIAANMVDFCDSDSYSTYKITGTDITALDGSDEHKIEYFGNEYVPYVNEVALSFHVTRQIDPSQNESTPPAELNYVYSLEVAPFLELLNIYPNKNRRHSGRQGENHHKRHRQADRRHRRNSHG